MIFYKNSYIFIISMEIISLTELKYIHNRNDYLSRNANKINNLKKIYSYKTFFNKENQKEKLSVNNKKPNSVASKNSSYSNINEVKTPFNKLHSFNFRYIKRKIPLKFSLYSVLAMKKNNNPEQNFRSIFLFPAG